MLLVSEWFCQSRGSWSEEVIPVPRRNKALGDSDNFGGLRRTINDTVEKDQLSKLVLVQNLVLLASLDEPTVTYCMWPEPNKGYKTGHLLKYWENLQYNCFYEDKGKSRASLIQLVGYSTDSAGFSLATAVQMMTPTHLEVEAGIHFLGLGTEDKRFHAPYNWIGSFLLLPIWTMTTNRSSWKNWSMRPMILLRR